jgi:hypothetical protein
MKVQLSEDKTIKGKLHEAGDIVIVNKDLGERLISEGVANRIVGEVDNRITVASDNRGHRRFSTHHICGRGSATISNSSADSSSSTTTDADTPITYTKE